MTITVLACDGTWSRPGARSPVMEAVKRRLSDKFDFQYVEYPASFGAATGVRDLSYEESVAQGVKALTAAVRGTQNLVVIVGYSQGAAVAVKFARDILPQHPELEVLAIATLGDPHNPYHDGRSGIAGALSVPVKRFTVFVPGDPIADLPAGSLLRSIADLGGWMSIRSPEAVNRWGQKMISKVLQQWWRHPASVSGVVNQVRGYLGSKHSTDYVKFGHVDRLVAMIETVA